MSPICSFSILYRFPDLLHHNIFLDPKSLKIAWVTTSDLYVLAASEGIGVKVPVLEKYIFVAL